LTAAPPAGIADVPAALVVLAITFLIARPAAESIGAATVIVVAKALVLLVFVAAAVPSMDGENFRPFFPYGTGGVLAGAAVAFFAFLGFDTVSTAAEEVRDPARDLPRGIIGSLVVTAVLYVVVALAMTGAVDYTRLGTADPLAEVMRLTGRPALAIVMNLGGVLATVTVLIAFQFGGARVVLNLARDGFIPGQLARVSARTGTPLVTTYAVGLVVAVAAAFLPLQVLVDVTNIATLLAFAAVLACVVVLRRREPEAPRPFRMPLVPWLPLVGIALLLTILATVRAPGTWFGFLAWVGLGLLIYGAYRAPRTRDAREVPSDDVRARPPEGGS
ncbi:MAG TPA: APC family permease, partial [Candidatus Thermoplasmatota archaeon]|nr:APC family permease [Candidatus Thermoplasmatota archaeon]